jgi:hypothetical protein
MSQTSMQSPHNQGRDQLELLWDNLLSRKPERIKSAFASLDTSSRKTVLIHLHHMANDAGWQPEQRLSALAAIEALQDPSHQVEK